MEKAALPTPEWLLLSSLRPSQHLPPGLQLAGTENVKQAAANPAAHHRDVLEAAREGLAVHVCVHGGTLQLDAAQRHLGCAHLLHRGLQRSTQEGA